MKLKLNKRYNGRLDTEEETISKLKVGWQISRLKHRKQKEWGKKSIRDLLDMK